LELVDKIKNGDQNAFEMLYDQYSGAIHGIILSIVKSEAVSEDITQDVFIKVWKQINSYNAKKGSLFTWMLNIARNASIDYLRKNKKLLIVENQIIDSNVDILAGDSNRQKIDHIGLREFVDRLEPEYRQVVEYLYFKGYTQQEMADELDMSLGTVKTRSRIATRELIKLIRLFILWI
jgi:RNA polymerase sigma-70 factor (ECF subfamily)